MKRYYFSLIVNLPFIMLVFVDESMALFSELVRLITLIILHSQFQETQPRFKLWNIVLDNYIENVYTGHTMLLFFHYKTNNRVILIHNTLHTCLHEKPNATFTTWWKIRMVIYSLLDVRVRLESVLFLLEYHSISLHMNFTR